MPPIPPRSHLLLAGVLAAGLAAPVPAGPALAQDAADLVVRLNRMEGQTRQMSGQIEQLQFENRQLKEQLRKFQEDVEYRLQEGKGGRPAAPAARPAPGSNPARRGDAFDPALDPTAAGAPRPLGSAPPSPPVAAAPPSRPLSPQAAIPARPLGSEDEDDEGGLPPPGLGAPVDLTPPGRVEGLNPAARPPSPGPAPGPPSLAAAGTGDPRADYDAAYAYLLQRQYERAEMGMRAFLQAHPRDRLVADATYWLGETYLQRNRAREAAEQFLKVTTDYARSAKAPDAMLKLGVSLGAIGAKDQACATFAELERKFPAASPAIRQGAERERTRARCMA